MPHRSRSPGLWLTFCFAAIGCGGGNVTLSRYAPPATAPPASPTPGLLYVGGIVSGAFQLLEFSAAASGNVAPLRMFDGYAPFGADQTGVWTVQLGGNVIAPSPAPTSNSSVAHYSPQGQLLATIEMQPSYGAAAGATDASGTIYVAEGLVGIFNPEDDIFPCYFPNGGVAINEYTAGSTGLARPFASLYSGNYAACDASSIAVDTHGNIWVAEGLMSLPTLEWNVLEYAAHSNGLQTPLRTISLSATVGPSIAVDSRGYLYVGQDGALLRYAPTSNIPQILFSGGEQYFVAVDSSDDVFACIAGASTTIEELKPGGGPPIRTIAGPKTLLAGAASIAITR